MKNLSTFLTLLLAASGFLSGCERSEGDVGALRDQGDSTEEAADVVLDYQAPDLEAQLSLLRQDHEVTNEFDACDADFRCDPPLRCIELQCQFPPAMTGVLSEPPRAVIIETDEGERRYFTEVVVRSSERQRGLMFRNLMLEEWGMLFIFERDEDRSFWMRNTYIPLDMVFIRSDGVIDSIVENAEPQTETSRRSDGPARFVLELNGGEAEEAGISAGQRVRFINVDVDAQ